MTPPINIDGTDITGGTIDGTDFSEVTVDGTTVFSAIPDSAIHQYDSKALTGLSNGDPVSSITDQIGSTNASANGDPTYASSGINGNPAVDLDGSGDSFTASFSQSQSLSIIAVVDVRSGGTNYVYSSDNSGDHPNLNVGTDDTITDFGSVTTISSNDESGQAIWTSVLDGANSIVRKSGTQLFSGDSGPDGVSSLFRMGERGADNADMLLGEYVIYDSALSSTEFAQEESRLSSKWGISI